MKKCSYFEKYDLEESIVVKFEHLAANGEVCIMFHPNFPHNLNLLEPEEQLVHSISYPYEVFHKVVFNGVSDYVRGGPICADFKNLDAFEEKVYENSELIMYGVENSKMGGKNNFSAVLSGFGEISFLYSKMDVDFKVVIEKGLGDFNKECLYIDVVTGNVGLIPDLFEPNKICIGDTVHLKSGGPKMTVKSLNGTEEKKSVNCNWFDRNDKKHTDEFPFQMLEKVENSAAKERELYT